MRLQQVVRIQQSWRKGSSGLNSIIVYLRTVLISTFKNLMSTGKPAGLAAIGAALVCVSNRRKPFPEFKSELGRARRLGLNDRQVICRED
jgi:hypothetical protein